MPCTNRDSAILSRLRFMSALQKPDDPIISVCSRGVVTKLHWLYYDDGWAQLRINRCIASLMDFQRSLLSNSTSEDSLSRFVGNSDFSRDSGKREENQIVRETFENWNIFSLPFEYSFLHVYRPPVYHILSR